MQWQTFDFRFVFCSIFYVIDVVVVGGVTVCAAIHTLQVLICARKQADKLNGYLARFSQNYWSRETTKTFSLKSSLTDYDVTNQIQINHKNNFIIYCNRARARALNEIYAEIFYFRQILQKLLVSYCGAWPAIWYWMMNNNDKWMDRRKQAINYACCQMVINSAINRCTQHRQWNFRTCTAFNEERAQHEKLTY